MTEGTPQANSERRRAPKRRATQQTILEAARKLLETRDPSELTLELVATEANLPLETVETCFRSANDLILALSAEELAGLARAMYSDRKDERQWMSASSGALSLLRAAKQILGENGARPEDDEAADHGTAAEDVPESTPERPAKPKLFGLSLLRKSTPAEALAKQGNIGPELGQILSDLTSDEMAVPDTATTIARLERRLYLVERSFADKQEELDREKANASVMVEETLGNLSQRLKAIEKLQHDMSAELQMGMSDVAGRLRLLEALPPSPAAVRESQEAAQLARKEPEPIITPAAANEAYSVALSSLVPESSTSSPANDTKVDNVLAAARRAAIEAAVERAKSDDGGRSRLLLPLSGALTPKKGSKTRPLALLGIGGVAIIVVAWFVGYRNGALEPPPSPQQEIAQPGTVVAAPLPVPQAAPLEKLVELASTGDNKAELLLGLRYLEGQGVPRDEAEAFHWFQEASEGGEPLAQYWLANLYSREKSPMADAAEAVRWYDAAARAGNRMAMNNLAVAHADGIGTVKNMSEAARWFGEAAALGYVVSQFNLAVLYERGDGVPQDLGEAYKWYAVAAAQGDGEAQKRVAALGAELNAEQLAAARAEAAAFKAKPMDRAANFPPELN
jgi:AcrR family transcriptional regulator